MAHVEDYLRALYLPPQELLAWARAHPQYSVRHRTALVALNGVSSGLKKREQQARRPRRPLDAPRAETDSPPHPPTHPPPQDLLDSLAKQDG